MISGFEVRYSCGHIDVLTNEQLANSRQKREHAADVYLCRKCDSEIGNGKPYLSAKTVPHSEPSVFQRIENARRIYLPDKNRRTIGDMLRSASENRKKNNDDEAIPWHLQMGAMYSTPESSPMAH
jgi:hypothetical protein